MALLQSSNYTKLTSDDALTIRAYLNTIPAVHNPVKSDQLPFPFSMRWTLAVWDALFFTSGTFHPDPHRSAEWNRGAYLAEGPGHCGMCHTPKNFLGGDDTSKSFQGYALQGWFAPNITNDPRRGLGGWSVDEIVAYLKTGHNKTSAATGLMSETLNPSTSKISVDDLKAIAIYLRDGTNANNTNETASADRPDQAVMNSGAQIYADECSGCHTANGKGIAGLFPSLNGSPVVQQTDPTTVLHVVLRGARSVGTTPAPTAPAMPQFGWIFSDDQIAAVVTYIRNAWGNSAPPVTAREVAKTRRRLVERSD
jgi:mono/diheme cytochrome c family protein